jgi:hypothetical protein
MTWGPLFFFLSPSKKRRKRGKVVSYSQATLPKLTNGMTPSTMDFIPSQIALTHCMTSVQEACA